MGIEEVIDSIEGLEQLPPRTHFIDFEGDEWFVVPRMPYQHADDNRIFFNAVTGPSGRYRADRVPLPVTIIRPTANMKYHDAYECEEGTHCVGELRHELLVNPLDEQLPDSAPVEFNVIQSDGDFPLEIVGASVSNEEFELVLAPKTTEDISIEEVSTADPGVYVDHEAILWIRTQHHTWVKSDGSVYNNGQISTLIKDETLTLALWKLNLHSEYAEDGSN